LRLFYLLWLSGVQDESVADDAVEPMQGLGPLTGALEAFADFFAIDPDLVQAAAELEADRGAMSRDDLRRALAAISEHDKTELLLRIAEGEAHAATELKRSLREQSPGGGTAPSRTAGALRRRAQAIAQERDRALAERREAERRRKAEQAEKARRARLDAIKKRGSASVWREIEDEIGRRNPSGYDRAVSLLCDLHEGKKKFIERLVQLESDQGAADQTAPDLPGLQRGGARQ
jgi:hypothetical protein